MKQAIAGEPARPREDLNAPTPLVDLRTSAIIEEVKTLAKASAEEDYWQGMVAPDLAFYLKDNGYRK